MSDDTERLVVLLEAKVTEAQRAWERAEKKISDSHQKMRKGSKQATDGMEKDMQSFNGKLGQLVDSASQKFSGLGTAFVGGIIGGLTAGGLSAIVARVGNIAGEIARVGDEAARAGLGIRTFQELKFVAEQNRVGVDALVDGIKELNLRADEWIITGGGSAAEAFKRLGFSATELRDKLQDPSKLFTEIIGKLKDLDRAAQIRIADEIFGGTGGEQFVQLIEQGEDGIARTIERAHELGLVLDADIIAKADEVDRKFNQWSATLSTNVKGAIVEIADAMTSFLDGFGTLENELALIQSDMTAPFAEIEGYLAAAGRVAPEVEGQIRGIVDAYRDGSLSAQEASAELRALGSINLAAFPITAGISTVIAQLGNLAARAREVRNEIAAASRDPIGGGASWDNFNNTFFPKPVTRPELGGGGGGGGRRSAGASEAERQAKAIQTVIKALEFERAVLGLNEMEQDKMNRLRQAGVDASSEQGKQIVSLVEQLHAEKNAVDAATAAQKEFQQQFEAVTGAIGDAIGSLFDGPISDASQILDKLLGGFASLGQANLSASMDFLFGGAEGLGKAVQKGAEDGAEAGTITGQADFWSNMFGGSGGANGNPLMGALGSAAGGLGLGYQAQDPLMGGLGGALQGLPALMTGNPLPMIAGCVGGQIGGLFTDKGDQQ